MADDTEEIKDEPSDSPRRVLIREVPAWLAAALVVVLAIVIGGVGYAIGNSDSNNSDGVEPIANSREAPDGIVREAPHPPGAFGPGPRGLERRGGEGPGVGRGEGGEGECDRGGRHQGEDRDQQGDDDSNDGSENRGDEQDNSDPFSPEQGASFQT